MSALAADPGLRSRSTAVLAVASLAVALAALRWAAPFAQFDGGISSSAATFTLHGLLPYRDYWLLYGPLGGYLLTPVTAIFGPSLDLVRVCGLIVIFAQGGTAFVIVRSWAPHAAAMLIAIAAVLLPAALIGIEFSPWALAMTLALAGLYLAGRSANRPLVAGLLLGLAFASRLDVGAYALIAALLTRDRRSILAGFAIVAELNRRDFAIAFFDQLRARTVAAGGPPPLGLHVLMGRNAPDKIQNMIRNIADGRIAPVEMIARKT